MFFRHLFESGNGFTELYKYNKVYILNVEFNIAFRKNNLKLEILYAVKCIPYIAAYCILLF